jgi:hypothetical protein
MCVQWMKVKADLACRFLLPLLSLVALMPTVQCQEAASSAVDAAKPAVEVAPLVLPDAELSFERHVRPLLKTWCLDCHGGESTEGGLDLRQRRFLMRGGESGPGAVAGDAAGSLVLQRIRAGEMPPGEKKMAAADAAVLERWIAAGAPTLRDEPAELPPGLGITEEERSYWAFQPIRRPAIPQYSEALRVRTPIDALLMQQLQLRGLTFSPDADRRTLIRRASLDLLGIPPTPEQVDEFVNDAGSDAWERLIDRLLAAPQYGERWGRHWLDAAGYADSEGATNADAERGNAWRYRDYVIQSFNTDKPASRFIQEQLAGDELAGAVGSELTAEQTELLTAVGFLTLAADGTGSGDNSPAARNQTIADTLKIVSTSLLGLSVGCAQCHDHRYDPISQVDYYRLRAVFDPALDWQNWKTPAERQVSLYTSADRAKAAEVETRAAEVGRERGVKEAEYLRAALEQELTKYAEPLRGQLKLAYETAGDKRTEEQQALLKAYPAVNISPGVLYQYNQAAADDLKKYDERIAAIRAEKPVENFLRTVMEPAGHLPASHRFHRGEFGQPKEAVTPGELQAASLFTEAPEIPVDDPSLPTSGRRLAYAKWLTSGRHPLLARVLMNRLWLHHFGRTFVSTPGEFGRLGAEPQQLELLDWLAADFMEGGWTWKRMHRQILLSTVYRQSGVEQAEMAAIDPNNQLYWRKPLLRLDAEVVRDSILAVGGQLNLQSGGAPVGVKADDTGQVVEADSSGRRSVYVQVRRSQPLAMLAAFDAPVMELNCTGRAVTNSAPQALLMMNSQFALAGAEKLADAALRRAVARGGFASAEDPLVEVRLPRMTVWEVGTGRVRTAEEVVAQRATATGTQDAESSEWVNYEPLRFWTGSSFQAGATLPDPQSGWVLVNAQGGHPGDAEHAAIRRFHVPASGILSVAGALSRPAANGDGVRARLVSSVHGVLHEWTVVSGSVETPVANLAVQTGEVLDLVVDCLSTVESDSFAWPVVLGLVGADGARLGEWKSESAVVAPGTDPGLLPAALTEAWRLALGRGLTSEERVAVSAFVSEQGEWLTGAGKGRAADVVRQILVNVSQALIGGNEFLYSE